MIGQRFSRLVVLEHILTTTKSYNKKYRRLCDCGKVTEVWGASLRHNQTRSCGCLHSEITSEVTKKRNTRHGKSHIALFRVWCSMINRCNNKNSSHFKYYGGRGISVCKEWMENFESFYEFAISNCYQKGLQIDRTNNDGNYEPSNCRFVTLKENRRNRYTQLSVMRARVIRHLKEKTSLSIKQIADKYFVFPSTIRQVCINKTWI